MKKVFCFGIFELWVLSAISLTAFSLLEQETRVKIKRVEKKIYFI
jgi:hypothetical protein